MVYCNVCPEGLDFWYLSTHLGFYVPTPSNPLASVIFYFEALCILCALIDTAHRIENGARLLIYTDNLNSVHIFNSLSCLPSYNHLLRHAIDILLSHNIDLRVLHVPGVNNGVADALSRCHFSSALDLDPDLKISPFQPPRWTLGAAKK
jgi:hypothetical protein